VLDALDLVLGEWELVTARVPSLVTKLLTTVRTAQDFVDLLPSLAQLQSAVEDMWSSWPSEFSAVKTVVDASISIGGAVIQWISTGTPGPLADAQRWLAAARIGLDEWPETSSEWKISKQVLVLALDGLDMDRNVFFLPLQQAVSQLTGAAYTRWTGRPR
jgi:hypothetical protein